jgi:predicted DNA-binding transcriptional regulator YafY
VPRGNQLARQCQLLQLIESPAGIAVDDARKLDSTVRTIWRDLSALQKAGFPLYDDKGADGRPSLWKLEEQFTLGLPVKLSLGETAALVMSRDLLRPAGGGVLGAAVTSAFDKIGRVLSRDALRLLDQMREDHRCARRRRQATGPGGAEHVVLNPKAVFDRRRLDIRYSSMRRGEENRRQVDTYHPDTSG